MSRLSEVSKQVRSVTVVQCRKRCRATNCKVLQLKEFERCSVEDRNRGRWPSADTVTDGHSIRKGEFCICCETLDEHATCYYRMGLQKDSYAQKTISGVLFRVAMFIPSQFEAQSVRVAASLVSNRKSVLAHTTQSRAPPYSVLYPPTTAPLSIY